MKQRRQICPRIGEIEAGTRDLKAFNEPFATSLLWHLGGVIAKVLWAILEEVGKCLR